MSQLHIDTTLANFAQRSPDVLQDITRGQGGGLAHTALSNALPSLLSPPLLAPRDMCVRRQFQLSATDDQAAAASPFPSFLPHKPFSFFHFSPTLFPFISSVLSPSFPLPCQSALHFSSADIKAGPVGLRRNCVISGCA